MRKLGRLFMAQADDFTGRKRTVEATGLACAMVKVWETQCSQGVPARYLPTDWDYYNHSCMDIIYI